LELALKRRRCTAAVLSEKVPITTVSLSRIRKGKQVPEDETVARIAAVLDFPIDFFFDGDMDPIPEEAVSFRSLASITLRERQAAIAAGSFAYALSDWLKVKYNLPEANLIDCSQERDPAAAAVSLRQKWGLGEQPVGNLIKLLEVKGVRIFSLVENSRTLDAFSCWRNDEPFIFLNTLKTAEHSRFDAAHELGHLVLHKHGGSNQGRQAEEDANRFASSFLMPAADVLSQIPRIHTLKHVIVAKHRWGVSAAALIYRLHKLGRITDWQNRTFNIGLRKAYGNSEPEGLPRETSAVWKMVLDDLWRLGISKNKIAEDLHLPQGELENLLFGLTAVPDIGRPPPGKPFLRVV